MNQINSQGTGGHRGSASAQKSFWFPAHQQQTDRGCENQGKNVAVIVKYRIKHRAVNMGSGQSKQGQKYHADRDGDDSCAPIPLEHLAVFHQIGA